MIQDQSRSGGVYESETTSGGFVPALPRESQFRSRERSEGSWGAELERRIMSALTLAHWDTEQHPDADRVKVDFIVRRNIRRLQMPRPILIQATTWLDQSDKFVTFLETARQHFGDNNSFLYVECGSQEVRGRRKLAFDELPVITAIGNIVSFFGRAGDANVFRLRLTAEGNSFRRVKDPASEFGASSSSSSSSTASAPSRPRQSYESRPHSVGAVRGPFEFSSTGRDWSSPRLAGVGERQTGTLKAWKAVPGESYKDYGWIEAPDGERYNAYWKAFTEIESVNRIRNLVDTYGGEGPWTEMELPVTFRVAPAQQGGKRPRAVEIELVD